MELRKEERKNSTNAALPIFFVGWLLSRKIIQTDYPKKLKDIDCKVNDYFNKYPEVNVPIFESPSLFLGCREFLEALAKTDNKTDFFGRSSPISHSALNYNEVFCLYSFQDDYHEPEKFYGCCPTLKLLIDSGHVMVFTWKNGCEPEHIEGSDDFVPFLLQQEKMKVNQLSMELSQNVFTDSNVPSELNEILWDENEVGAIDFGPFDVESVENIEIERENMVSTSSSGTPDNPNVDSASQSNVPSSINERKPIVASGASARYLLDSVDGRQALLNDLLELNAFLQRFQEDLLERLDNESEHQLSRTGCNAFKPSGGIGCDTIQNIIIQVEKCCY
ncbi:uncharacterized protein DC041_0005967 [Schistosoma bovis]|uniref:Uncharacterized protein n=1 Tax=Schistosoma bovis TaxID=6184 RepID=A0A430QQP5_SCHBO|nr:uncharacterized protein DC041_0005967 [Schistosoma bovis]